MPYNLSQYESNRKTLIDYLERLQFWVTSLVREGTLELPVAQQYYNTASTKIFDYFKQSERDMRSPSNIWRVGVHEWDTKTLLSQLNLPFVTEVYAKGKTRPEQWTAFVGEKTVELAAKERQKSLVEIREERQYYQQTAKQQANISKVIPAYREYFKAGGFDEQQTESSLMNIALALSMGVSPDDLPQYDEVRAFTESKAEEQGAPLQVATSQMEYEYGVKPLLAARQLSVGQDEGELQAQRQQEWLREYTGNIRRYEQSRQEGITEMRGQPIDWIRKWQLEHAGGLYDKPGTRTIFTPMGVTYEPTAMGEFPKIGIPDIVSRFAPGVRTTNDVSQPLTVSPITTPSGQALGRMLPSERETLQGYAQYSGQYWPDILAKTAMMLPQPLRGSSWRARRQGG